MIWPELTVAEITTPTMANAVVWEDRKVKTSCSRRGSGTACAGSARTAPGIVEGGLRRFGGPRRHDGREGRLGVIAV